MTLRLAGSTSGYTEIDAPAVAGNNTLLLPTGNGSSGQFLQTNGSGTLSWSTSGLPAQVLTLGTSVASTSGTSIDFTSIPSTVKRITVMFSGVSSNGTSNFLIQLGTGSTTYTATGYAGQVNAIGAVITAMSTGFLVSNNILAANTNHGLVTLISLGSNIWAESGNIAPNNNSNYMCVSAGSVTLGATLTAVRITTVNGTDTFDAGTINIMYEG